MPPKKILVVEDNPDWQVRIREHIEGMGYETVLASSVIEARAKIVVAPQDYTLILLDPSLTEAGDDKEGLLFLDQLRERGIQTPCVLLTAHLTKELAKELINEYDVVAALEKADFSRKPAEVRNALHKAIRRTSNMVAPAEQLGVGILLEGVKFLFAELGRRLEFWRKKKGETEPQDVEGMEIIEQDGEFVLRLDDVVHPINVSAFRMLEGRIKTSLEILENSYTTLDTYRKRLTDPLISPKEEAFCKQKIPKLEEAIEQEASQLQEFIEKALE